MAGGGNVVRITGRTGILRTLAGDSIGTVAGNHIRNFVRDARMPGLVSLIVLGALAGCSKPPQTPVAETTLGPTGLETIPQPDPTKYPRLSDMGSWKNPYFVVRDDGIGMVDLSNREIHLLKPEEIPAELASLGSDAWPYGRIVLIAQAVPKNPTDQTKADLRKNRALLLGTLKELEVQFREAP
jgi:hypothetical protein